MDLSLLLSQYQSVLLGDVVPFWVQHAIDGDGGINTCIRDDGTVVNRDRWNWSQWRAVWVFSKLYNSIERRDEWLQAARGIFQYAVNHGPLDDGHWPLLLNSKGEVKRGFDSVYVDGFAIYGLAEYFRATRDEAALSLALSTFEAVEVALSGETPPPAWPYPIPRGQLAHGVSMLLSIAYWELSLVIDQNDVKEAALRHHKLVMNDFLRTDRGVVLEWLKKDGTECRPPHGTVVCPGHAIESMWFQIHIARSQGSRETIIIASEAIRKHLELGWDLEYGGLYLAVDADDSPDVAWPHAQSKLWWPHTEALYATLLAYEYTGENWCLDWHDRVRKYCFEKFSDSKDGEWTQKLDRKGNVISETLFLPVKDPFHLPRALLYNIEVLDRLVKGGRS